MITTECPPRLNTLLSPKRTVSDMRTFLAIAIIASFIIWTYAGFGAYYLHFHHSTATVGFSSKGCGASSPITTTRSPYHTIEEMQEWAGVPVDGKWGPVTDRAYKAKLNRQYGDAAALKLWPERDE